MTLDSNVTLVPANHLYMVTAKLVDALLDGGPSMLERALTVGGMDRLQLHIFLLFMIFLSNLLPILVSLFLSAAYSFCREKNFITQGGLSALTKFTRKSGPPANQTAVRGTPTIRSVVLSTATLRKCNLSSLKGC